MRFSLIVSFLALASLWSSLAGQSSDKYLRRMPQPESAMLYFIKPIAFKAKGTNIRLIPDFTYKYFPEAADRQPATMNFTVISKEPIQTVDPLSFGSGTSPVQSTPTFLYIEQKKGKWQSRFSLEFPIETLLALLEPDGFHFSITCQGRQYAFPSNKQWEKAAETIRPILRAELK